MVASTPSFRCVSIVLPVYNEVENIHVCRDEIVEVMESAGLNYEIVFVDDGSSDGTTALLRDFAKDDCNTVVLLRRNYGQTAAMHAGIQQASGDVIVTMDSDLQNDPRDIPALLAALEEGNDLAFGWRHDRQDKFLSRRLPSMLANGLISRVVGFPINDLGCTLKAIRSDIAKELELYGEMHRFIPILAANNGALCTEVKVNHRPRIHGESKYGIGRWIRVLLDLLTVQYMCKYFSSPMKLFGLVGFICACVASVSYAATLSMKLGMGTDITGNPLTYLAVLFTIVALQFFGVGLLSELSVRIYYSDGKKNNYHVRHVLSTNSEPGAPHPGSAAYTDHEEARPATVSKEREAEAATA